MSGSLNTLVTVVVVAMVFIRQFQAQRVTAESKNGWLIPAVLAVMALRKPGLLDSAHHTLSVVLLAAGVAIGLASGAAWAWTSRMWTDDDGGVWTKGGWATAGVWFGGMALRLGLVGIAAALGIHQGTPATMLAVAAMLLTRTGVTTWRAQSLRATYRVPVAG
ncbi:DUF1453 family protein [Streptomyces piniterrae]|uniref:DUF1453 family protein n=1 Tax=Streptomyces piniterrae TaxID=2571125 RepID=A0A4U0MLR7_9ACTN|nr:DUF1453 family protein [Streptomyces piniterrae]TJZ41587.1 DUF1453 family protein [Streptomyces piniterrae]